MSAFTYDHWVTTNPADEFLGPDPEAEEELPEPVIDEEWSASRGEYETTITLVSGSKYALRQNAADEWEVHGPDRFFMSFSTEKAALSWLTGWNW